MAVDPATIKAAVKVAVKVLTDEETRKKVFAVVLAPLIGAILIISMFFYILTMPLQWLSNFFSGDQYDSARAVRVEHGYDQYIDPADEDYLNSAGLDFSGV